MKHLVLGAVAIVAIGVMLLLLARDRDRDSGRFFGRVMGGVEGRKEGFEEGDNQYIYNTYIGDPVTRPVASQTVDAQDEDKEFVYGRNNDQYYDYDAQYESLKDHIDEVCQNPLQDQLNHIANKPFTMIWADDYDTIRLDPEEYNSDVTFYAYGEGAGLNPEVATLNTYKEHIDEMAAVINKKQVDNKVPVVQDPRCSFVDKNLPNSDKFIFFNNNKLLSHPDGPLEPNKCYIPPYVANVLYNDKLCTADNELIYNKRFEDIVEIEGLDVSARVDKDIGTPMCVLKFKTEEKSPLSGDDYKKKLEEYLQYLYKMDPERQYWKESTQWLFNKNYDDQKIIGLHMADKEWLKNRLISVQSLLDKLRERVGIKVGETWDNQKDGYMQDPNLYMNDFIAATVFKENDVNRENTKEPQRIADMAEKCADNEDVGRHLIHLQEEYFGPNVVDKWKSYEYGQNNPDSRGQIVTKYVTDNAVFASVWARDGDGDKGTKQKKCETLVEVDESEGGLGFSTIADDTNYFLLREHGLNAENHYRNMCTWEDLESVDIDQGSIKKRKESCGWASTVATDTTGNYTYNCSQFGDLFKPDEGVTNYFTKLKNVRGKDENVDDELISFLTDEERDVTVVPAFSNFQDKCIYRNEEEGGCESVYEDRFPVAPKTDTPLKGKGAIAQGVTYDNDAQDRTGDTNLVWGPNLIVSNEGGTVTISGRPLSTFEDKLDNVAKNENGVIKMNDGYEIYKKDLQEGKKLAYLGLNQPNGITLALDPESSHYLDDNYQNWKKNDWDDKKNVAYTPGTATCKLDYGKMIVDENDWIHAPTNVETGHNVKVSSVDDKGDDDPKNSTVKCELDVEENKIYKPEYDTGTDAVKLAEYECGSVNPSAQTVHIGTDNEQTSYIKSDAGMPGSYHTFSRKDQSGQQYGEFTQVTTGGLVLLDNDGKSKGISINNNDSIDTPVNLGIGKYDYKGDGTFIEYECEVTTDTGPGEPGLYHYTSPTEYETKGDRVLVYNRDENTFETPVCGDIPGCAAATTTEPVTYTINDTPTGLTDNAGLGQNRQISTDVTYGIDPGYSVFEVPDSFDSDTCYNISINDNKIAELSECENGTENEKIGEIGEECPAAQTSSCSLGNKHTAIKLEQSVGGEVHGIMRDKYYWTNLVDSEIGDEDGNLLGGVEDKVYSVERVEQNTNISPKGIKLVEAKKVCENGGGERTFEYVQMGGLKGGKNMEIQVKTLNEAANFCRNNRQCSGFMMNGTDFSYVGGNFQNQITEGDGTLFRKMLLCGDAEIETAFVVAADAEEIDDVEEEVQDKSTEKGTDTESDVDNDCDTEYQDLNPNNNVAVIVHNSKILQQWPRDGAVDTIWDPNSNEVYELSQTAKDEGYTLILKKGWKAFTWNRRTKPKPSYTSSRSTKGHRKPYFWAEKCDFFGDQDPGDDWIYIFKYEDDTDPQDQSDDTKWTSLQNGVYRIDESSTYAFRNGRIEFDGQQMQEGGNFAYKSGADVSFLQGTRGMYQIQLGDGVYLTKNGNGYGTTTTDNDASEFKVEKIELDDYENLKVAYDENTEYSIQAKPEKERYPGPLYVVHASNPPVVAWDQGKDFRDIGRYKVTITKRNDKTVNIRFVYAQTRSKHLQVLDTRDYAKSLSLRAGVDENDDDHQGTFLHLVKIPYDKSDAVMIIGKHNNKWKALLATHESVYGARLKWQDLVSPGNLSAENVYMSYHRFATSDTTRKWYIVSRPEVSNVPEQPPANNANNPVSDFNQALWNLSGANLSRKLPNGRFVIKVLANNNTYKYANKKNGQLHYSHLRGDADTFEVEDGKLKVGDEYFYILLNAIAIAAENESLNETQLGFESTEDGHWRLNKLGEALWVTFDWTAAKGFRTYFTSEKAKAKKFVFEAQPHKEGYEFYTPPTDKTFVRSASDRSKYMFTPAELMNMVRLGNAVKYNDRWKVRFVGKDENKFNIRFESVWGSSNSRNIRASTNESVSNQYLAANPDESSRQFYLITEDGNKTFYIVGKPTGANTYHYLKREPTTSYLRWKDTEKDDIQNFDPSDDATKDDGRWEATGCTSNYIEKEVVAIPDQDLIKNKGTILTYPALGFAKIACDSIADCSGVVEKPWLFGKQYKLYRGSTQAGGGSTVHERGCE